MVLKVDKILEPDAKVKFEEQRAALEKVVFEKKLEAEIPVVMKKLLSEAKPVFILKKPNDQFEVEHELDQKIQPAGGIARPPQ